MYDWVMFFSFAPAIDPVDGTADKFELRTEVNNVAGLRNALDGRVVDIARWLLANNHWQGEGLAKPEQYLAFRCGLTLASARRYVDVARRADELPESVASLRAGEISLDQLMPIVRRVPAWADDQVVRLAKKLSVGQINAVINKYDFDRSGPTDAAVESEVTTPAPTEPVAQPDDPTANTTSLERPAPLPADRSWFGVGDDGRWRMHAETTPEQGLIIEAAIRDRRDRAFRDTGVTITDVEALTTACGRSLDAIKDPARRERFRTNVHLHTDRPNTDALGRTLPEAITQHLACDGMLTPIFHESGVPISVGRTQRIVPDRTRKIVLLRDRGCVVPGCGATLHLEIHHIIHWSDGGQTDTSNLVSLCGHHHREHHHHRLGITGNADHPNGLTITNQHGISVADVGPRPRPPTGPPPKPAGTYRPPLGERLDMNYVDFAHPQRLAFRAEQARAHAQQRRDDQHQTPPQGAPNTPLA